MAEEMKQFWCSCYVLGRKKERIYVRDKPVMTGRCMEAENRTQARQIFDEKYSQFHEFKEWW
jgi:hypothetical protein